MAEALVLRFRADRTPEMRDLAAATLLDFSTSAIHEISDEEWRVFLRDPAEQARAAEALRSWCDVTTLSVDDEDWARRSQQDLKAVTVGRVIVAPPWDLPRSDHLDRDDGHTIVIEPSMGFGTAHHATTRLCLRALQQIDLGGKLVLDVGTGSGVLAIAAAVLGAARVVAVDNDPDALAAARENVQRNGVSVELLLVDLRQAMLERADVVVANLTGALLQRSAAILSALARGGVLIVSGLLDEEVPAVREVFAPHSSHVAHDHESGWSSLTLTIP